MEVRVSGGRLIRASRSTSDAAVVHSASDVEPTLPAFQSPYVTSGSSQPTVRRRIGLLARLLPAIFSLLAHLVLLTILLVFSVNVTGARSAAYATLQLDTSLDIPKDVFESNGWDVESDEELREPRAAQLAQADDSSLRRTERGPDDATKALAGLNAVPSLVGDDATRGGSLADGLGAGASLGGANDVEFFGARAKGEKVVYCIDRSASMLENGAWAMAQDELLRSLHRLGPTMRFQVIFYNHEFSFLESLPAARGLALANAVVRDRAAREIRAAQPAGGTDHLKALQRALEFKPDIIYMLSDAEDDVEKINDLVQRITRTNQAKARREQDRASIHVIQFHHDSTRPPMDAIRRLAERNNGVYRLINVGKSRDD